MNDTLGIEPYSPEAEPAFIRALCHAFACQAEEIPPWFDRAGRDNIRIARAGGDVAGGMILIPMGQFIRGQSIPMWGIAGVAIAPECRGQGVAARMMRSTLEEMRERGVALSTLYASIGTLYRAVGYEEAGCTWGSRAAIRALPRQHALRARSLVETDAPAVEALYRDRAAATNGWLDRCPYIWSKVRSPRGEEARGYGVEEEGRLTGYLYLTRRERPGEERRDVNLTDFIASTSASHAALLALIADESSMSEEVTLAASPSHSFSAGIESRDLKVTLREAWLLRLVHVPAALEARPFPAGLNVSLHLDVQDSVLPENAGPVHVEISDGNARVTPGGDARVRLDVGALAALFSGFRSAQHLRLAGRIQGSDEDLSVVTRAFSASAPEMVDFF